MERTPKKSPRDPIDPNPEADSTRTPVRRIRSVPGEVGARQLSLFQTFYGRDSERDRYSNVFELWDAAPKYLTQHQQKDQAAIQNLKYLERFFEWRGKSFRILVTPALLVGKDGQSVKRFPGAREELVEDALRKIAVLQHHGFVEADRDSTILGVRFSLSTLRQELARHGHAIRYDSLYESLLILSGCHVEVTPADRRFAVQRSPILPTLSGRTHEEWCSDPRSRWLAHFHPMVSRGLSTIDYRQYDYQATMSYRRALTRWVHKRLAVIYSNAGMLQPHSFLLSTIVDNSGLIHRPNVRHRARDLDDALKEMQHSAYPVIRTYQGNTVWEGRRLVDVQFTIWPTAEFVKQVIAANRRQGDARRAGEPNGDSGARK
jgi:hypothetical protein